MTIQPVAIGNPDAYIAQYRDHGCAWIRGALSTDDINRMRAAGFIALANLPEAKARGYKHFPLDAVRLRHGFSPRILQWPSIVSQELNAYRFHPRLMEIVGNILGPDVRQFINQFFFRLPGDDDTFSWHQDIMFRSPRSAYRDLFDPFSYLQAAMLIDPMNIANGGLHFLPGSHALGDLELVEYPPRGDAMHRFDGSYRHPATANLPVFVPDAQPGDILLWTITVAHGSGRNITNGTRMYYMNGFMKAGCCDAWPHYTVGGQPQELDVAAIE